MERNQPSARHKRRVELGSNLDDVAAYRDCRLHETYSGGDHEIFVGEVLALEVTLEVPPLLFPGGGYRYLNTDA